MPTTRFYLTDTNVGGNNQVLTPQPPRQAGHYNIHPGGADLIAGPEGLGINGYGGDGPIFYDLAYNKDTGWYIQAATQGAANNSPAYLVRSKNINGPWERVTGGYAWETKSQICTATYIPGYYIQSGQKLAYVKGYFLITDNDGVIYKNSSGDGIGWTAVYTPSPGIFPWKVKVWNNLYNQFTSNYDGFRIVMLAETEVVYCDDFGGNIWTRTGSVLTDNARNIDYKPNTDQFLIVGASGSTCITTNAAFMTTFTTGTWGSTESILGVAYNPARNEWIAASVGGIVKTSSTGLTGSWTATSFSGQFNDFNDLAYSSYHNIIVGCGTGRQIVSWGAIDYVPIIGIGSSFKFYEYQDSADTIEYWALNIIEDEYYNDNLVENIYINTSSTPYSIFNYTRDRYAGCPYFYISGSQYPGISDDFDWPTPYPALANLPAMTPIALNLKYMTTDTPSGRTVKTSTMYSWATTNPQQPLMGRWCTYPIAGSQQLSISEFRLNIAGSESNLNLNYTINTVYIYVLRPSVTNFDDRGFYGNPVFPLTGDSLLFLTGFEPTTTNTYYVQDENYIQSGFTGNLTYDILDGDVIVVELYSYLTNGMSTQYTANIMYNGNTINTTQGSTVTDHASFIELTTANDLTFKRMSPTPITIVTT